MTDSPGHVEVTVEEFNGPVVPMLVTIDANGDVTIVAELSPNWSPDEGEGMLLAELLEPSTLAYIEKVKSR